jgi:TolA-binding protein
MQYINSNLGIPIKSSFADMMNMDCYSNASGDSVSAIKSKISSLENEIRQLQVKKAKEDEKVRRELTKIEEAQKTIKKGKIREGNKMRNEADYAIREARAEIRNLDSKINLLTIDLNDLKIQVPSVPSASAPSVPQILPTSTASAGSGGSGSAGIVPLPETGNTSENGSSGAPKKTNWVLLAGVGLAGYVALAYFVNKFVKPQ